MKVSRCQSRDIWGENAPVAKWPGDLGLALRKIRFCGQFFDKRRDKIVTSVSAQSFLTSNGYVMISLMLQFVLILSDIHEKMSGKRYKSIKFCSGHIWWAMGWDGGNCNGHTLPPPNVTKETLVVKTKPQSDHISHRCQFSLTASYKSSLPKVDLHSWVEFRKLTIELTLELVTAHYSFVTIWEFPAPPVEALL